MAVFSGFELSGLRTRRKSEEEGTFLCVYFLEGGNEGESIDAEVECVGLLEDQWQEVDVLRISKVEVRRVRDKSSDMSSHRRAWRLV